MSLVMADVRPDQPNLHITANDLLVEHGFADAADAERQAVTYRLLLSVALEQLHDLRIEADRREAVHRRVVEEFKSFRSQIMRASLHETDA